MNEYHANEAIKTNGWEKGGKNSKIVRYEPPWAYVCDVDTPVFRL